MKFFVCIAMFLACLSQAQALSLDRVSDITQKVNTAASTDQENTVGSGKLLQDEILKSYAKKASHVDAKTLQFIGGGLIYFYAKDSNGVYFGSKFKKVPADMASFEYLSGSFARDKSSAFFGEKVISGVDITTFSPANVKGDWQKKSTETISNFSYDKKSLYFEEKKLGIRFVYNDIVSKNCVLQKSKHILCYNILKKETAFPIDGNITAFGEGYFSDSKQLMYVSDYEVKTLSSDIKNTNYFGSGYLSDSQNVYKNGKVIGGMNPKNLEIFSQLYIKNDEKVYFFDREIIGADPKTFSVFEGVQYGPLSLLYARDASHIYKNGVVLPGKDPATFNINTEIEQVTKDGIGEALFGNSSWYTKLKSILQIVVVFDIGFIILLLYFASKSMYRNNYLQSLSRTFLVFVVGFMVFFAVNMQLHPVLPSPFYFVIAFFLILPILKYVFHEDIPWVQGFLKIFLFPILTYFGVYFLIGLVGGMFFASKFF